MSGLFIGAASVLQFKGNGYLIPLLDGFSIDGGWIEAPGFYGIGRCLVEARKTAGGFYFDEPGCAIATDLHTQNHSPLFIQSLGRGWVSRLGIGRCVGRGNADAGF